MRAPSISAGLFCTLYVPNKGEIIAPCGAAELWVEQCRYLNIAERKINRVRVNKDIFIPGFER